MCSLVVGSPSDRLVRSIAGVLGKCGVRFGFCDDVYSAIGELAGMQGDNILVIGRLGQLSREKGQFLRIVSERGIACCCLADGDLVRRRRLVLDALDSGAFVVSEPAEVEEVLTELLTEETSCPAPKERQTRRPATTDREATGRADDGGAYLRKQKGQARPAFMKDEFRTTKAELDALLGA